MKYIITITQMTESPDAQNSYPVVKEVFKQEIEDLDVAAVVVCANSKKKTE